MNNKIVTTIVTGALLSPVYGDEISPSAGDSNEASEEKGAAAVTTYTGPKNVDLIKPRYPEDQIHRNQEGWVHLNFMVDTSGKPYEITVADAVGDEEFQEAAIRALKQSEFEPARLDGEPIESGANYSYSFELQGGSGGARRQFVRRYRRLIDAIDAGDRAAADELLADLEADNLYESAYLEFGRFTYHRKWGTPQQQMKALHHAVGWDEATTHLNDALFQNALRNLFGLQTQLQDFGGALSTAERLYKLPLEDDLKALLDRAVEEIEALRHEPRSLAVEGVIDDTSYSWHLTLFKRSFRLDQVRGRVAEIKLRCAGRFVGFVYDEELVYRVSERHMPCNLEVVGDPGTRFRLVQS